MSDVNIDVADMRLQVKTIVAVCIDDRVVPLTVLTEVLNADPA